MNQCKECDHLFDDLGIYAQFSRSVVSDSFRPHGLEHARLPCPSPTPWAYSSSCPSSRWCHPTISHPLFPSPSPSIFPSIRVFSNESVLIRWPQYWSFSFSTLPMNIQGWFPLELIVLISFQSKGLSRVYSSNSVWKYPFFCLHQSLCFNSQPYMTNGKIVALTIQTFVGKVMSLPFNMLSMFAIDILRRNKHVLNSWLHSLFTVILESMKIKSVSASNFSPLFATKWWE